MENTQAQAVRVKKGISCFLLKQFGISDGLVSPGKNPGKLFPLMKEAKHRSRVFFFFTWHHQPQCTEGHWHVKEPDCSLLNPTLRSEFGTRIHHRGGNILQVLTMWLEVSKMSYRIGILDNSGKKKKVRIWSNSGTLYPKLSLKYTC